MSPRPDFIGRTAIVTGGTRGIGKAIARELCERGARVCITARKAEELEDAVRELDPEGTGGVIMSRGSADDVEHQRATVELVMRSWGRIDMLVNNAGTNTHFGSLLDAELGSVRKTFDVNVHAVLSWTQLTWRAFQRENGGAILNIASLGGLVPSSLIGVYNCSKAALIHLTRHLADEMGPSTRVNAIAPAVIKTDFARAVYERDEVAVAARYPLKRLGLPEDAARLGVFLLSDDSAWITGQTVVIDGGLMVAGA
jgi:NAD(P)-dependent dehydrogenase (short-subunit alcohol dehydrogenase family)